mmetsp:Transcript_29941/g.75438  ORF Transcript_29941/g.75438 Transcript_29941/m.75438 type:complete len:101 (-) Transcript_29941:16-318(-)
MDMYASSMDTDLLATAGCFSISKEMAVETSDMLANEGCFSAPMDVAASWMDMAAEACDLLDTEGCFGVAAKMLRAWGQNVVSNGQCTLLTYNQQLGGTAT